MDYRPLWLHHKNKSDPKKRKKKKKEKAAIGGNLWVRAGDFWGD